MTFSLTFVVDGDENTVRGYARWMQRLAASQDGFSILSCDLAPMPLPEEKTDEKTDLELAAETGVVTIGGVN